MLASWLIALACSLIAAHPFDSRVCPAYDLYMDDHFELIKAFGKTVFGPSIDL